MENLHSLLKRQLKRYLNPADPLPKEWQNIIDAVNKAYREFDTDRSMLERSLDISSQELLQANSEMQAVFQAFPDLFLRLDLNGTILDYKSENVMELFLDAEGLRGKRIQNLLLGTVGNKFDNAICQLQKTNSMVSIEYSFLRKNSESFYEARLVPLFDNQIIVIIRNITDRIEAEKEIKKLNETLEHRVIERTLALKKTNQQLEKEIKEHKQVEKALRESELKFRSVTESANEAIISADSTGTIIYWNKGAQTIFGYDEDEIMGKPFTSLMPERYRDDRQKRMDGMQMGLDSRMIGKTVEMDGLRKDGTEFPLEISLATWKTEKGTFYSAIIRDVTERETAKNALAEQAIRDGLTDLYNRRYFNQRLNEEIVRANRNKESLAILLCDLDHFKAINDTQGHHVGDNTLKEVAKSFLESTRGSDLVFRWGGDEITVILLKASREGVLNVADRIRIGVAKVSRRIHLDLDLSIGVAIYPEHGQSVDELIRLADRSLYIAKKGGDKIHIGDEEYHLDNRSIKVVFQPIVDIRSNQIIAYEALSRDPQGKVSILELFKRYQAIGRLSELKRICFKSQLQATQQVGLKRVFINVDFNLINQLELVPKPPGIEVILEISELEALHDVENHLRITRKWRKGGFKFAIDDFGAGFISLPFIAQAIPDYIKMDRSTILQAVNSEKFRMFSKDLVQALRNYSKEGIIAEGVETEKELQVVKSMGIYFVQGFLLGKPMELASR